MLNVELSYLKSRVGTRILILFICCALLPLSAMTLFSFRQVTDVLSSYSRQLLYQESKAIGMSIFERLSFFRMNLKRLSIMINYSTGNAAQDIDPELLGFFREKAMGLMICTPQGTLCLIEPAFAFSTEMLSTEQKEHLAAGEACLLQRTDTAGNTGLYMLLEKITPDNGSFLICAAINLNAFALSITEDISDDHMQLLVLDADNRFLISSTAANRTIPRDLSQKVLHASTGTVEWQDAGDFYFAGIWTLFLRYRFLLDHFKIVLSMPSATILYPVSQFKQTFIYTVFLSFWIVLLLSLVQIRRSLVPLQKLTEGTRQLALQDFTTRIEISGKDEFGELAASFNTMAAQLDRQFYTIKAMSDIDRAILSSLNTHIIIVRTLKGVFRLFDCSFVAILLVEPEQPQVATLYHTAVSSNHENLPEPIVMNDSDAGLLQSFASHSIYHSQQDLLPPLRRDTTGCSSYLVIPMLINKKVNGLVCLGFSRPAQCSNDVITQAGQLTDQLAVALANAQLLEKLEQFNLGTLTALARAVDAKSGWTAGHSERVTRIALKIATVMGLPLDERETLQRGGLLHDIGKIGIPAEILDKPGKLSDEEFRIVREHPALGVRILEPIKAYAEIMSLVRQHHEHYDGTGYPDGLAGNEISCLARILSVADVFEAIITDRPYRKGMELATACRIIAEGSGKHFDPEIASVFLKMLENIKNSCYAADDLRAAVVTCLTEN